jgi:hypothetical protein
VIARHPDTAEIINARQLRPGMVVQKNQLVDSGLSMVFIRVLNQAYS